MTQLQELYDLTNRPTCQPMHADWIAVRASGAVFFRTLRFWLLAKWWGFTARLWRARYGLFAFAWVAMVSTSLTLIAMQAQSSSVPARFVNQPASDVIIINNSPEFRERLSLDVQGPQIDVGNYSPGEKIVAKTAPGVGVAAIMEPETESGASS